MPEGRSIMDYVWDLEAEVKHLRQQVREFHAPERRWNWAIFGAGVFLGSGVMTLIRMLIK